MSNERLYFRPKRGIEDKIDAFEETSPRVSDQSEAIRKLIEIGYREATEPLGRRIRDILVDWASRLAMFGILAFVLALTHPTLNQSDGILLSAALLVVSVTLLASAGLVRVVTGHGESGLDARRGVAELLEVVR